MVQGCLVMTQVLECIILLQTEELWPWVQCLICTGISECAGNIRKCEGKSTVY